MLVFNIQSFHKTLAVMQCQRFVLLKNIIVKKCVCHIFSNYNTIVGNVKCNLWQPLK